MESNFNIIPVFPTPLLKISLPSKYSNIISWFYNQPKSQPDNEENPNNFGISSLNTYILDESKCKDLKDFILEITLKYATDFLNYSSKSYKITQSWISIKQPNQKHSQHTHPNSLISGVLYYGKITKNTSSIIFHKSRPHPSNVGVISPSFNLNNPNLNIYSSDFFPLSPEPGDLILFPSWLAHSVPLNTTDFDRHSLAFNIVPSEGFGDERNLSQLKFN